LREPFSGANYVNCKGRPPVAAQVSGVLVGSSFWRVKGLDVDVRCGKLWAR